MKEEEDCYCASYIFIYYYNIKNKIFRHRIRSDDLQVQNPSVAQLVSHLVS